jgi:hypothetical protein
MLDEETVEQIREYWFSGGFRQHTQLSQRLECAVDDINFLLGMLNGAEEEIVRLKKVEEEFKSWIPFLAVHGCFEEVKDV